MCFSPVASFTASAVLGVIGLMTLAKVRSKKALPLAALPLLLSLQQFVEGIVWLSSGTVQQICSYAFLAIALIFWPLWVPFSLLLLEKRNKWILSTLAVGAFVAISSLIRLFLYGSVTTIGCNNIAYSYISNEGPYQPGFGTVLLISYIYAVAVPFFFSSLKWAYFAGLSIGVGLIVSLIFYAHAFGSVWCFFGALSSLFIYFVIRALPKK